MERDRIGQDTGKDYGLGNVAFHIYGYHVL